MGESLMNGQDLVAEASMGILDVLDQDNRLEGGKVVAVGVVCIVEVGVKDEAETMTRVYTTERMYHRSLGLMREGYEVAKDGIASDDPSGGEHEG
jgi:hypothetical protein